MKRRNKARDRARRRRWQRLAAKRFRRQPALALANSAASAPVRRTFGDIELVVDPEGLRLCALDYHVAPVHLTSADLASLGLCLVGGAEDARPPSVALPWRAALHCAPDRMELGPAMTTRGWALPPGRRVGGFLLARVVGGLDVFVTEYHARKTRLGPEDLAALDLAWSAKAAASNRRT